MCYSDDPYRDYDRWERDQEEALKYCPVCCCCGLAVQDEYYYDVDGDIFCQDCLHDEFKKSTEDYVNAKAEAEREPDPGE